MEELEEDKHEPTNQSNKPELYTVFDQKNKEEVLEVT